MIYLLKSPGWNGEILLKIGYAESIDNRFKQHLTSNPCIELLYQRDGDRELESLFHKYFEIFSYKGRKEWFRFNQLIVDKFFTITKEELELAIGIKLSTEKEIQEFFSSYYVKKYKKENKSPQDLYTLEKSILLKDLHIEIDKNFELKDIYKEDGGDEFYLSIFREKLQDIYDRCICNISNYDYISLLKSYFDLSSGITINSSYIVGMGCNGNILKIEIDDYFKPTVDRNKVSKEEFDRWIEKKMEATNILLRSIDNQAGDGEARSMTLYKYEIAAKTERYRNDYLSINYHSGNSKEPAFNNLVLVSERRAFDIQQIDYADRCSVRNIIEQRMNLDEGLISIILKEFESKVTFIDKMKYLCCSLAHPLIDNESKNNILKQVDVVFSNYYIVLGPELIQGYSYQRSKLEREYKKVIGNQNINIADNIYSRFNEGDKLSKDSIKNQLRNLYNSLGYKKTPKASDLEEWFELKPIKVKDDLGKWVHGFEIIKKKE